MGRSKTLKCTLGVHSTLPTSPSRCPAYLPRSPAPCARSLRWHHPEPISGRCRPRSVRPFRPPSSWRSFLLPLPALAAYRMWPRHPLRELSAPEQTAWSEISTNRSKTCEAQPTRGGGVSSTLFSLRASVHWIDAPGNNDVPLTRESQRKCIPNSLQSRACQHLQRGSPRWLGISSIEIVSRTGAFLP
jgi:hypothetical protein